MRLRTAIPLLLLAILATGCRGPAGAEAGRPGPGLEAHEGSGPEVFLAPGARFRLCAPETGPDLFVTQEVTLLFPGGRRETVLAAIENRGGRMGLVASSPLGQTLFSVQLQGGTAQVEVRAPMPGGLDLKLLPALVQFALWPDAALRANLGPGLELEQDGARRSLRRRGRVLWTVTRDGDAPPYRELRLDAPDLAVGVRIRTLED